MKEAQKIHLDCNYDRNYMFIKAVLNGKKSDVVAWEQKEWGTECYPIFTFMDGSILEFTITNTVYVADVKWYENVEELLAA